MVKRLLLAGAGVVLLLAACSSDKNVSTAKADAGAAYPSGPYDLTVASTLPEGLSFDGESGPVNLDSLYEPNAAKSRIAILRESATWCGTCQWHASHTARLLGDPQFAGRLELVDFLIADRDNVAATRDALIDWRTKIDAPQTLAIDTHYTFEPALLARGALPLYVFIDTKTMKVLRALSNPDPTTLAGNLAIDLAQLDGWPPPAMPAPPLTDALFTEDQMDLIHDMKLDPSAGPPPDPTNQYGDSPTAVTLGKALFEDKSLSPTGTVSCSKCHDESQDLSDGLPQAVGVATGDRNSPAIALASHSRWQFWDGRADTLWMQALLPFEDAREFGSNRLFVAHRIADQYATQYSALFGADPKSISALPPNGKPGDAAWDALSADDKDRATRIFVNVGKSIAAFERAIRVKTNALDDYAGGNTAALTDDQKHSLLSFFQNGCAQCHYGPRLTDDAFHNLRFPTGRQDGQADPGRSDGLTKLAASEFLASSKFSDSPSSAKTFAASDAALGAFKTPSLRGVANTAPFGHGGSLHDLGMVTSQYSTRGVSKEDPRAAGNTEEWVPLFDANAAQLMPTFLQVLTAPIVLPN